MRGPMTKARVLLGMPALLCTWLSACAPDEPAAHPLSPPPSVSVEPPVVEPPAEPPPPRPPELTTAQVVKVYQDCWAAVNAKDFAKLAPCYADAATSELVDAGLPPAKGKDIVDRQVRAFVQAFPDLLAEPRLTLANGNQVLGIWRLQGTHQGTLDSPVGELHPTGRRVEHLLAHLVEFEGGRAMKTATYSDIRTLLGQLGVYPAAARKAPPEQVGDRAAVLASGSPAETQNLASYRKYVDAFNVHEMRGIEPLLADDFVYSDQASPADRVGKAEGQRGIQEIWKAMSDARIEPKAVWAASDYVVATSTLSGTNDGPVPALKLWKQTGKKVTLSTLEVLQFQGEKVKQHWVFSNGLTLANQLGVPLPAKAPAAKPQAPAAKPQASAAPLGANKAVESSKPAVPAEPGEPPKAVAPVSPAGSVKAAP